MDTSSGVAFWTAWTGGCITVVSHCTKMLNAPFNLSWMLSKKQQHRFPNDCIPFHHQQSNSTTNLSQIVPEKSEASHTHTEFTNTPHAIRCSGSENSAQNWTGFINAERNRSKVHRQNLKYIYNFFMAAWSCLDLHPLQHLVFLLLAWSFRNHTKWDQMNKNKMVINWKE